ncbi:MAG: Mrp/NBP35 family ATP-binding protein [Phycisphaerales bacterium]|nr:Mrp/NBP35 family ATP-binding protein [Phycisphaerales bacterium]
MEQAAHAAHTALAARFAQSGTPLQSLIVEFIDEQGTSVHTTRFGSPTPPNAAAPAPPAQAPSAEGHRPIGGLAPAAPAAGPLPGVRHIIAVGAGKGGVGKSSIAVNLAVGLARRGHAVGLLDGDIYGPSIPTMLGLGALEQSVHQGRLQPFLVHGVKAITIGKLVDPEKPLIWRGPMAHGAFKQLTEQTAWGELDYLIIDLPPGTGDISLTMAQTLRLAGAVVVCTPQKVAQDDAVRAARMFQQLNVEVLGVVENMSYFIGDDGKTYDIFGRGGAEQMAQRLGVPFLGAVPITMSLRQNSDTGDPTANFTGQAPAEQRLAKSLDQLITNFEGQVALADMRQGRARPTLTIS